MKTLVALAAFSTTIALSTSALAQATKGFGESGEIILGVDRLMPFFSYESIKTTSGNTSSNATSTSISFVGHGRTISFYNQPRFALDYTVTRHLTVGGSFYAYFQVDSGFSSTTNGVTTTYNTSKETLWGIAPRVGYIIPLGDVVAFWPRGGFSFNDANHSAFSVGNTNFTSGSTTQFALDIEPTFVFVPVPHVGITAALALDVPLTGSTDVPVSNNLTLNEDLTEFHVGAHVGLLVYF